MPRSAARSPAPARPRASSRAPWTRSGSGTSRAAGAQIQQGMTQQMLPVPGLLARYGFEENAGTVVSSSVPDGAHRHRDRRPDLGPGRALHGSERSRSELADRTRREPGRRAGPPVLEHEHRGGPGRLQRLSLDVAAGRRIGHAGQRRGPGDGDELLRSRRGQRRRILLRDHGCRHRGPRVAAVERGQRHAGHGRRPLNHPERHESVRDVRRGAGAQRAEPHARAVVPAHREPAWARARAAAASPMRSR